MLVSLFLITLYLHVFCFNLKAELLDPAIDLKNMASGENLYEENYDSLNDVVYIDDISLKNVRSKKDAKVWDHWGKWSACSVTCGVGKITRWRHCISNECAPGEKEAQIKTCTLKPC
ncbi:ADAMTS-like protein 1 [Diabrotica virgifera virgifera]|uniref:ADAMTS-like protein 1 n=1 Tax=Diabrotica virgifera virgifera TaxID=50390 RepID=A0A6P7G1W5_DIAVI|nr:ADAMTS-like protein 1 [Diabrotica virgifera virgifera]